MSNIPCKSSVTSLINNIVFVIDASGSMSSLTDAVIKVFDGQIQYLATRSTELGQETRVTIYFFDTAVECCVYDTDVLRLPSIKEKYMPSGSTALIDGVCRALYDLEKKPQLYGDTANLLFCISDGGENASKTKSAEMAQKIASMPNNWTLCCLVPDQICAFEAKKFGFPNQNVVIWDTSAAGLHKAGDSIKAATEAFMLNHAKGIKGSTNLFQVDMSNVTSATVQQKLHELDPATYDIYQVDADQAIKAFVEAKTGNPLVKGNAYYMLNKKELIQAYKKILIREQATGKVYGGNNARDLLKLPPTDIEVKPTDHNTFDIFIESTSVNRKVIAGTSVIVVK